MALAELSVSTSFREGGLNEEHVHRLVALAGHWPPVLVNRPDGLVIDGAHRVEAARILGLDRIEAWYFDGGPDDALIEFVRRNVHQGLPLTLRERKRAAEHVLVGSSRMVRPSHRGALRHFAEDGGSSPGEDDGASN